MRRRELGQIGHKDQPILQEKRTADDLGCIVTRAIELGGIARDHLESRQIGHFLQSAAMHRDAGGIALLSINQQAVVGAERPRTPVHHRRRAVKMHGQLTAGELDRGALRGRRAIHRQRRAEGFDQHRVGIHVHARSTESRAAADIPRLHHLHAGIAPDDGAGHFRLHPRPRLLIAGGGHIPRPPQQRPDLVIEAPEHVLLVAPGVRPAAEAQPVILSCLCRQDGQQQEVLHRVEAVMVPGQEHPTRRDLAGRHPQHIDDAHTRARAGAREPVRAGDFFKQLGGEDQRGAENLLHVGAALAAVAAGREVVHEDAQALQAVFEQRIARGRGPAATAIHPADERGGQ